MIIPSYENALLWHERDLANSSSERFTLSHSMILLDDVISKCDRVLSSLVVNRSRMKKNIDSQNGLIMAEKIMLELVDRGMPRDTAHEELRSASMVAVESGSNLEEVCRGSESIMKLFDEGEISGLFEPESHLGSSIEIVDRSISIAMGQMSEE
jgi:adenylosuccinate lyase